ncbi:MAG TPA: DnaA N-terminal domain-containing protein, partial [Polyangiaceae bacterium]|nr:DnaA N-terminal domain-containing protein [Polyangiaceae bacterium]
MLPISTPHDPWSQALDHTRRRSPATFEQWFSSVEFAAFSGSTLSLVARDEFVRDWVKDHFQPTLVA